MSGDFGTVNVSRRERAREIEVMREHYRRHRETLEALVSDAPTEHLAQQYARLAGDIDGALRKLDELEGVAAPSAAAPPPPPPPPAADVPPLPPGGGAGTRTLADPPRHAHPDDDGEPKLRVALIILAAVVALALIGWLIWRASDRGDDTGAIIEADGTAPVVSETLEPATATDAPVPSGLTVDPPVQDFGVVRKGTRAVRQYTITNTTGEPAAIKVSRSECRCLYYQHAPVIPPNAKETLSVTVDAARAQAGELKETLQVTTSDPSVKASLDVLATIR